MGGFDIPTNDLTILKENIAKVYEFQRDNSAEIEAASYNQQAILEEIWTEEQAKLRKKEGVWQCVASVVTIVVGGAAIILSGGAATPIVLGVGTVVFGTSNAIEGGQDIYYGSVSDISSQSFNPIRDTVFFGNQRAYDIAECIVTFAAGSSIPLTNAVKMGKVVTTVDKAKFIGVEIFKEAVGTVGGFGGVWLGEKLGLSQEQSMLLGMTTSIVSSKGADWVDNNLDNLIFAGKYTFNNSGKNVVLGCNGVGPINTFFDTFTDIKNGKIVFNSIDDVINSGINSVDDLMKLGVNSVDDLAKLKVSSINDLAKIGIKNADDLAKLGIDSSDLKKIGIDSKVFEGVGEAVEENYVLFNKTHKGSAPVPKGTGPNGGRLQSHHGLQQQWAKENLSKYGYDPDLAPTVTIETGKGMPHTSLSNAQNTRRNARVASGNGKWSSSLQDELGYMVDDFTNAGFSKDTINGVLEQQYKMLDKLKVPYERIDIK